MGLKKRLDITKKKLAQEPEESTQGSQEYSFPAVEPSTGKKPETIRKILVKIDPARCRPWKYHNRNEWWLTSERSEALVDSIKQQGQMQPGIVRRIENDPDSPIGVWRTQKDFVLLAKRFGWQASFRKMPAQYYSSHYRYDVVLSHE